MFFRALLLAFLVQWPLRAAAEVNVAVVGDGEPQGQSIRMQQLFMDEISVLAKGEFEVRFSPYPGDWTAQGIEQAFESALADPHVDMVLVLGIAANQLAVGRSAYPKPVFLPLVIDAQLVDAPADGNRSGLANLNYLTDGLKFAEDLSALRRVAPFRHVTLIGDQIVISSVRGLKERTRRLAREIGVEISFLGHRGEDHKLVDRLPEGTDAVVVTTLPRMPPADFDALLESLIQARMPAFSLLGGAPSVTRGFLASDAVGQDWLRLARRTALNMQAVMLGERAEDQPILFEGKRQLTINMQTARRIGLSPRFDVLSEAVLINEEPESEGPKVGLLEVARMASERNLLLAAQRLSTAAGQADVDQARAGFLPQASLGTDYTSRKLTPQVQQGFAAERSLDAAVQLGQVVYDDDIWANAAIQQQLQVSRESLLEQTRLDTILSATNAFLDVLRAETRLRINQSNLNLSRSNLDLARDRVRVGASSSADVFRWQSQMATARADVLAARATVLQAREALNRVLNQPLVTRLQIRPPTVDEPFAFSEAEFNQVIDNPRRWALFVDYLVNEGLERAPELAQIDAQLTAKGRELTNLRRDFWLPDFSLSGRYSDNLDQSGVTAFEGQEDWMVMLSASLPLFSGGARRAAVSRAELEVQQLQLQRASTRERIEQSIRASMHRINAAYASIRLSREAAQASRRNLELVTDQYAKGLVTIIELLDAQTSSLRADEAAENAVYDFLVEALTGQRATGQFDFTLPAEERQVSAQQIRDYFARIEGADQR